MTVKLMKTENIFEVVIFIFKALYKDNWEKDRKKCL